MMGLSNSITQTHSSLFLCWGVGGGGFSFLFSFSIREPKLKVN